MLTDLQLLSRYHSHGDATAFQDLVQAHAGMVFATARRVTRDDAMAEDVVQETFFQLARQSRHITQSVAAWLHRVAWRRACNAVRDDSTRRRIEEEAAATEAAVRDPSGDEVSWAEVEKELDAALDELPDDLRGPLVMHFLQGRSQRDIAIQAGVSQSTISRTVEEGLSILRGQLKNRGVLCGAGLAALLMANYASAAPAALLVSLGKISLTGAGATTMAPAAAAAIPWVKTAVAASLIAGGSWVLMHREAPQRAVAPPVMAESSSSTQQPVALSAPKSQVPPAASLPAKVADAAPNAKPVPRHELVHSFQMPPSRPNGHLALDAAGKLWGTTSMGGRYGLGTLYRMNPDGSDWEEMVSFNGREGLPKGGQPWAGVQKAADGRIWGITGNNHCPSTLYSFDAVSGQHQVEVEFDSRESPRGCPACMPDGRVWFSTSRGIFHYDPALKKRTLVKALQPRGNLSPGEWTPDGQGWLWATAEDQQHGGVCKINVSTGEFIEVFRFTGAAGAFPGSYPACGLTLDSEGYLWGCTRNGGATNKGTIFKIHVPSGAFAPVAQFQPQNGVNPGINPETRLIDDGRGFMWGTTSYLGSNQHTRMGQGTIYKVERSTGKLAPVVTFTRVGGSTPGGPARGHLLRAGPDHFIGVCDFGGGADSGLIYRMDIDTGKYTVLRDMASLAATPDGVEPHGALVEAADGSLWGTASNHGAHQCGTIYKIDPVTHQWVTVVDFTGRDGTHPGRYPDAGLVSDGSGWLWGTTRMGGTMHAGNIFKLNEQTGQFINVADFGADRNKLPGGGPMTEMIRDERGQLWGTTLSTVFKVDPRTNSVKHIMAFGGDTREPFGSELGKLAADGRGHVWGVSLGDRTHGKASLFRIRTSDDGFEVVRSYPDALAGWSGWHPMGNMERSRDGSIWFTGVLEQGGARPHVSLNRLDPATGQVRSFFSPRFAIIETPVEDAHGRLWGSTAMSGRYDAVYSFEPENGRFERVVEFTGQGSQDRAGDVPMFGRQIRASDGNIYSVTRYGGPGNGGTIYRLRFGPTPMTQEAVVLADGRVELHGVLKPNGRDSLAAFEYGTDPLLKDAKVAEAGAVRGTEPAKSVQAVISDLPRGVTHYFRVRGINPDNAVPQRGAVLQFIIPKEGGDDTKLVAADDQTKNAAQTGTAANSTKHRLKIVMIPGAGAGIVRGRLQGAAYEIGKTYSLTAHADNRYVFASWSGPGISGALAENPKLDFTFTEELARKPVITATFVLNPFHEGLLGAHHGLVRPQEGVEHTTSTSGALEMQIEDLGYFQGILRYDGDELPFNGVFDTGGSARFGNALAFIGMLQRESKPALLLSLSLDMSADGPGGVYGQVGTFEGENAVWKSQVHAPLSLPVAKLASDPVIQHLTSKGSLPFEISMLDSGDKTAVQLVLQPEGSFSVSTRMPDGTEVLAPGHLSPASRLSFFQPLPGEKPGSLGFDVLLPDLLQMPPEAGSSPQGWWQPAGQPNRFLMLRPASAEKAQ